MKNLKVMLITFQSLLFFKVSILFNQNLYAQLLVAPVDSWEITQAFSAYNAIGNAKYHSGIDTRRNGLSDPYAAQRQVRVKVARSGVIYKIFGLRLGSNYYIRRWNPNTISYTWTAAPNTGSNRGLGQCIIIYHPDINRYTLYGHLDAIHFDLSIGISSTTRL